MSLEESPWTKIAIASATIAAGTLAYKSGLLKQGVKMFVDNAGKMTGKASDLTTITKNWINSTELNSKFSDSLVRNTGLISYDSLFSKKGIGALRDYSKRLLSKESRDGILKQTTEDFSYLSRNLKERAKTLDALKAGKVSEDSGATMLMRLKNRVKDNQADFDRYVSPEAGKAAGVQSATDMYNKMVLSEEKRAKQLKRTGYRSATISDFFMIEKTNEGTVILPKESSKKFSEDFMKEVVELGNMEIRGSDGKHLKLLEAANFKEMVIDEGIMIGKNGNISDLRHLNNAFKSTVEMAASQFQIPVIGINPLRLFGLDNIKKTVDDFGTFLPGTHQGAINASKELSTKPYLLSAGSVFEIGTDGVMNKIKSNVSAERIYRDSKMSSRQAEAYLKLAGVRKSDIEEYTKEDGVFNYLKGKTGKFLDLGRSDRSNFSNRDLGLGDKLNPNEYIKKMTNWLFDGTEKRRGLASTVKSMEKNKGFNYQHFGDIDFNTTEAAERITDATARLLDTGGVPLLIAKNNAIKITDALLQRNDATLGKFAGQFFAGRKNLDQVTTATLNLFHVTDRINSTLNIAHLGLSVDSMSSSQAILGNLILKRALPVVAGYNAFEYLNYLTEDEETGDNVSKKVARGIVNTKLTVFRAKDALGITDVAKKITELTPGSDHITELPGVNTLDLDKTEEEMRDYYENGYDPIRKGRYWDMGVQAFTGSKISWYRPNWYRRVEADVKFSDSMHGSREEYFKNAPFPTPSHLFAPVRHFITDPYHWEKKHYHDRPYPVTAPAFANVPVVGPLLGSTVGRVIKPQIKMHREEMNANRSVQGGSSVYMMPTGNADLDQANQVLSQGDSSGLYSSGGARPALYTTASGKISVVGLNQDVNAAEVRGVLENRGIGSAVGVIQRLDINTGVSEAPDEEYIDMNGVATSIGDTYNNLTDFLGIYGYASRTVTGRANQGTIRMETSSYATSMGKMFWDQEIGGLGGEINEIFRRFIPKRGPDDNYYNPIRNTQGDWMTGSDYFIDFKHGDPYVKVKAGEERLAGEGYERLHGIDIYNMRIGSSSLGKTKDEIIDHYLKRDPILEGTLSDEVTKAGDKIHKQIEKDWLNSGYAIEVEGKIEDTENNIIGYYDARVHDPSAPGQQAIIDIKTVSDKIFSEIKKDGIREDHKRQVNYYLWALGLQRGGVYYVNRDTGETLDLKFDFDKDAFNSSMRNVYDARAEIMKGIENGNVSRGDLYSHVDRLRILADVAPYSNEYREMAAIVSRSRLSEEEEEEVRQIRERVSNQKKPLRTYDYKFSTADIVKEHVNVSRMYDYNTIYLREYDAPLRMAGITVRSGDTEEEKEKIAQYMEDVFGVGDNLTIGVDKASNLQKKAGSIRAVVYKNGRNINKELIDLGYAKVNENDEGAAAIHGRYNAGERLFGSIWEKFAHLDTPFHTKFLKVRSPFENYERERVYGKEFTEWHDPYEDYLKPMVFDRNVNRGTVTGIVWGAIVGSMFGTKRFGRTIGALVGAGAVAAGKVYKEGYEAVTDSKWKPKRIRQENEIHEYMDMLKYIKSKKLYNEYADRALREDHVDVRRLIGAKRSQGKDRKNDRYELQEIKQNVKRSGTFVGSIRSILGGNFEAIVNPFGDEKEELRKINAKISEKQGHRELLTSFKRGLKSPSWEEIDKIQALQVLQSDVLKYDPVVEDIELRLAEYGVRGVRARDLKNFNANRIAGKVQEEINRIAEKSGLTDNVVKAIQYYNESEQTMYGYDKGDPITNLLAAMPKKDRDYFNLFVNAPEEERMKILELVPKYMRRPLMISWGMKPEEKPSLLAYFKNHALPDADWRGWDEDVSLNAVRVKMFKKADLDFSDVNVWQDDIDEANRVGKIDIPKLDVRSNSHLIRSDLYDILGKQGVKDLRIESYYSNTDSDINLDLTYDSRARISQEMEKYERDLIG